MANKKRITKQEIKDWFIIQRIRTLNFIKEHKYISAGIGTFILSCIILLVAFANSNDEYINEIKATINSVGQPNLSENSTIRSFSTQVYDINYSLGLKENSSKGTCQDNETIIRDNVVITASYVADKYVDAHWVIISGQEYTAEYGMTDDVEDKTKLKLTTYSVKACETIHQQIYLKINNATPGAKITTTISIVDGPTSNTSDYDKSLVASNTIETTIDSNLTELTLSPIIKGGKAYTNKGKIEDGKLVPFGIILKGNTDSLEGKYFNPNQEIDLSVVDNFGTELDLITDDSNFYGKYDDSNIIIDGMPDEVSSNASEVKVETSDSEVVSPESTSVSTSNVKLNGSMQVELLQDEEYEELGIIINDSESLECVSSKNCEKSIIKRNDEEELGDETVDEINVPGEYQITYKYPKNSNTYTILKRNVYVIEDNAGELDSESLTDNSTEEESENQQEQTAYIMRVNSINVKKGETINPVIYINDEEQVCDSDNLCSVSYYKDSSLTESVTNINTIVGTYYVKYVYEDEENGILLQAVNTITISGLSKIHKLRITDLKIGDEVITSDGEVVFGTYFVTVKSSVPENRHFVNVTLSSGDSSATVENYRKSSGSKINELTFNTDESGGLELLSENTVAYGQEVILKSSLNYMNDGDTNITTLTNKIPLGNSFTLKECATGDENSLEVCAYDSENSSLQYYLSIGDKEIVGITNEDNPQYLNEDNELSTLDGITFISDVSGEEIGYTITNIAPGTIIDFRVRLITGTLYNSADPYTITSSVNYKQPSSTSEEEIETPMDDESVSIFITPFKSRNRILVNEFEQDTIINGANVNKSMFSIYPSVSLPANLINTNAVSAENIEAKVIVTLPEGINYIYNESYNVPSVSSDGRTLTYNIENVVVNEWIEPIVFEGSYDIDIESGSELIIESEIQVTAKNLSGTTDDKTDISSKELRTASRKIIYQNDEEIAYLQYASKSAVSKDEEFSMNVEIYNNTSDVKTNVDIITVLPYNDEEMSNFNGYYLATFDSNTLCTSDVVTQEAIKNNSITWSSCDEFENNSDSENRISALKTTFESLESSQKEASEITINPVDNQTGDKYVFSSYVVTHNQNSISVSHMDNLTISVVSKQISGIVWEDFDDDGIMSDNEKRISDVTLKLYDSSTDEMVSSTISDENGKYILSDLEDNATYYVVAEFNNVKYGISPRVGTDKSVNSSFYSTEKQETIQLSNSRVLTDEDLDSGEELEGDDYPENSEDAGDSDETEDDAGLEEELPTDEGQPASNVLIRTDDIYISPNTKVVNNINLGLSLQKVYTVTLNKYITKAIVTNNLGVTTTKDYGKATLAKLDVKDINKLNIKVIYTIELENTGYYPGYIYNVKDYIPDGMSFNESYEENNGWTLNSDGYIENKTLFEDLVESGQKKYLTLALDISRKEAGSFINSVSVEEEDLQMLVISKGKGE